MATQHYCLTGTGTSKNGGAQFTVHTEGDIRDAMKVLQKVARIATSHGRGCTCPNPTERHPNNTIIRDGELVPQ